MNKFPTGWALQKPLQTIEPADFEAKMRKGQLRATLKRDGNRGHILTAGDMTRVYSRNGTLDWTDKLPHIVERYASAPAGYIIDAELHTLEEGTESFQWAMNNDPSLVRASSFDMLDIAGTLASKSYDHRTQARRGIEDALGYENNAWGGGVDFELPQNATYEEVLAIIEEMKIEGVVMWDGSAPHALNLNGNTKRGKSWKIKIRQTEDLIVMGYNACKDPSLGVGTLILARDVNGTRKIVAKVGSFNKSFDRIAAMSISDPYVVEISHFGTDENNNFVFPKIERKRDDLATDFGLAKAA